MNQITEIVARNARSLADGYLAKNYRSLPHEDREDVVNDALTSIIRHAARTGTTIESYLHADTETGEIDSPQGRDMIITIARRRLFRFVQKREAARMRHQTWRMLQGEPGSAEEQCEPAVIARDAIQRAREILMERTDALAGAALLALEVHISEMSLREYAEHNELCVRTVQRHYLLGIKELRNVLRVLGFDPDR